MSSTLHGFSEKYNNFLAPEAVVWIDEKKLSAEGIFFTSLEVNKSMDAADTFSFTVADAIDLEFELKQEKLFALGNKVEIHIGYADSNQDKSALSMLFVGLITNINWHFGEENYLDITVEGSDYSFFLMKHSYKKPFQEMTLSSVVEELITQVYPQTFTNIEIESTDIVYPQEVNQEENDYLYITSLANRIGYAFHIEKENFYFKPVPQNQERALTLYYGKELLSFKPELNVEQEVSSVKVVGLEFSSNNEAIIGKAQRDTTAFSNSDTGLQALLRKVNSVEYEVRESVKSLEEANIRAASLLQNFSFNFFKAEITLIGIPDLIPGMTIGLEGLGKRFSRDYYVEKTLHTISSEGYETTVSVRSNASAFKVAG